MDAVTHVPTPTNETVLDYAPGSPERKDLEAALVDLAGTRHDLPHTIGGARVTGNGERIEVRQPHAHRKVLGRDPRRDEGRRRSRHRCRHGRGPRLARPRVRRPGRDPPQGGRPPRRPLASPDQRRDDAGTEQDRIPGGDRQRVRAHRLLAVQRPLRPPDHGGAAAGQLARPVEPQRLPLPRGLRLRRDALQLHGDRGQPPDGAGAHGQHRRLEALALPAARRPADHGAARGGRDAARRHQPRHRPRPRGLGRRALAPGVRGAALHRLDRGVPGAVAPDRGEPHAATGTTRASSARPVARTSSSPTPAPTPTCCAPP